MKLSPSQEVLGVALSGSVLIGLHAAPPITPDVRPSYPTGVVCGTPMYTGETPHSLAADSRFSSTSTTVIQRSQFLNPNALLEYVSGDDKHYQGPFNVDLKPGIHTLDEQLNTALEANIKKGEYSVDTTWIDHQATTDESYYGSLDGDCTTNKSDPELVSTFPTINAAKKILEATVALREGRQRTYLEDEVAYRRCGGIAITETKLLLPSTKYVAADGSCVGLVSGEAGNKPLKIAGDKDDQQFRFVETSGAELQPIEIAADYTPKKDDILIYSGYTRGGARQYFRVRVEGVDNAGRIAVRADIDQVIADSYNDGEKEAPILEHMYNGSGGFFRLDGKLVAVSESTADYAKPYTWFDEDPILPSEYQSYLRKQDKQLAKYNDKLDQYLKGYGVSDISTDLKRYDEQFITGLLVPSDIAQQAVNASK